MFTIPVEVKEDNVAETIAQAFSENGVWHWASVPYIENAVREEQIYDVLENQSHIIVNDKNTGTEYRIARESIQFALNLMAKDSFPWFSDIVEDGGDAEAGDTLIQLACFGHIKYFNKFFSDKRDKEHFVNLSNLPEKIREKVERLIGRILDEKGLERMR